MVTMVDVNSWAFLKTSRAGNNSSRPGCSKISPVIRSKISGKDPGMHQQKSSIWATCPCSPTSDRDIHCLSCQKHAPNNHNSFLENHHHHSYFKIMADGDLITQERCCQKGNTFVLIQSGFSNSCQIYLFIDYGWTELIMLAYTNSSPSPSSLATEPSGPKVR